MRFLIFISLLLALVINTATKIDSMYESLDNKSTTQPIIVAFLRG